jgi:hypothetical protein
MARRCGWQEGQGRVGKERAADQKVEDSADRDRGDQKGHPGCEPTQGPGKYRERPEHQDDQQVGDQGLHDQRQEREHAGDGIRPGICAAGVPS